MGSNHQLFPYKENPLPIEVMACILECSYRDLHSDTKFRRLVLCLIKL